MHRYHTLLAVMLCALLLAGCGATAATVSAETEPKPTTSPSPVPLSPDQQPAPTPMIGAWEDFPPDTYPPPFAINRDVVLNMSAGCPNLTDATERVAAD